MAVMPGYDADPQVVPYLLYEDAGAAMDWLIRVFGFTERVRDRQSDGTVQHGELLTGNGGVIMLGSPGSGFPRACQTWRGHPVAVHHDRRSPGASRARAGCGGRGVRGLDAGRPRA